MDTVMAYRSSRGQERQSGVSTVKDRLNVCDQGPVKSRPCTSSVCAPEESEPNGRSRLFDSRQDGCSGKSRYRNLRALRRSNCSDPMCATTFGPCGRPPTASASLGAWPSQENADRKTCGENCGVTRSEGGK